MQDPEGMQYQMAFTRESREEFERRLPGSSHNFESTCDDHHDTAAKGSFMQLNTFKFIGAIYILNKVIPILHTVSKSFQKGSVTFLLIAPSIAYAKMKLEQEAQSHQAIYDAV